ncbi:hypothetical protein ACGF0K_24985 [Streptomyces sp. NPDC048156]|uniref:hypothetical protein n=1 Tax=Streptomyces sp. NPDC048156 TaxID=3365502 RepID=UPI00371A5426
MTTAMGGLTIGGTESSMRAVRVSLTAGIGLSVVDPDVVSKTEIGKSIEYIPSTPTYRKTGAPAGHLAASAGCFRRETTSTGSIKCGTGKPGSGDPNCAVLPLQSTHARRDAALREAIKYQGVPAELVTAGNWTVNLCDTTLGAKVARDLGGVVVAYDGR